MKLSPIPKPSRPGDAAPLRERAWRFWLALVPPLAALALQEAAWSLIQPYVWFLFYPAVFASSWIGGFWAGIRATALSTAIVLWFFVAPLHTLIKPDSRAWFPTAVFIAMGLLFSTIHERLRRSEREHRRSEAKALSLLECTPEGIVGLDRDGRCTFANAAALRLLGLGHARELIGRDAQALLRPRAGGRDACPLLEPLVTGAGMHVDDATFSRADGSAIEVEYRAHPIASADGAVGVVVSFSDIADRKRGQSELRRAATVFESTNEAILVTDASERIVAVNPAFCTLTGYTPREAVGATPRLNRSGRHDEAFYRDMHDALRLHGQWQGEIWNRRKDGSEYPVWETISAVRDPQGRPSHYVAMLADISPLKRAEERLRHVALHDALTGLPNRRYFGEALEGALARAQRHGKRVALLFLDLDRFKLVNDTLGHAAGDGLLQEVAHRLRAQVRAEDLVARLGGDEFTIVVEELDRAEHAALLARKLIEAVGRPLVLDGREVTPSASVGIAMYPDDAASVDDLGKAADAALYRAKDRGRHTFDFYTPDITAAAAERLSTENGLRRALWDDQLELHYQPQIGLPDGRLVGFEALLRWNRPGQGLVLPERFIAVAEDSGLIRPLGAWVIDRACAQARAWLDEGLEPRRLSINVSGTQITHDQLVETVGSALAEHRLDPGAMEIELEITESVLQSMERSAGVLEELRALGLRIAIDDFGTGYSSLSLLKHLPIDTLKIDQVFIRGLDDDADARAIVAAMITMGHTVGLRLVAEGVETAAQRDFLVAQGCDEVQGHLYGAAQDAAATTHWLRAARDTREPAQPIAG